MQFPQSYFEDEVREGFYIPSMVKCSWAAQLEVLEDIDKVCKKYKISYFAISGTLLGAVRHGGFIPWDDDMDLCMTRPDYERFLAVAGRELPEGYSIVEMRHDAEWDEMFARIVNSRRFRIDMPFLEKFHGFPYIAGVDIFPLDYLAPNEEELEILINLVKPIIICAESTEHEDMDQNEVEEQVSQIEELCNVKLDRSRSLKNELYRLATKLCTLYREQESDKLGMTPDWVRNLKMQWPKEYYKETVSLPFEVTEIAVPIGYDEVLRSIFGEYMRIVYDGGTHDYPFYKKWEKMFGEQVKPLTHRYQFYIEDFVGNGCNVTDTLVQIKDRKASSGRKEKTGRKEIVFLPYKASVWDSLESVWKVAVSDLACDVYVIPIPYYEKNWDGSLGKRHYEGDGFPDYVTVTRYDKFDFAKHYPDMIYIQFPYDEYHYTRSVEPFFYTKNLINYTDKLIYIPCFVVDEIKPENEKALENAKTFINVPGVFYADKVIVQSENMRQVYIDTLAEFAGEDTRAIWEEKIAGIGSPKMDKAQKGQKVGLPIPTEWKEMIQKPDGSAKKVILYHNSVSTLLQYQGQMLKKIEDTFQIFREKQEEVVLLWRPNPFIQVSVSQTHPQLWRAYQEIVNRFKEEKLGIYDDMEDFDLAVAVCDAYYGDADHEMNLCRREGKPVMWQNVNIINGIEEGQ